MEWLEKRYMYLLTNRRTALKKITIWTHKHHPLRTASTVYHRTDEVAGEESTIITQPRDTTTTTTEKKTHTDSCCVVIFRFSFSEHSLKQNICVCATWKKNVFFSSSFASHICLFPMQKNVNVACVPSPFLPYYYTVTPSPSIQTHMPCVFIMRFPLWNGAKKIMRFFINTIYHKNIQNIQKIKTYTHHLQQLTT